MNKPYGVSFARADKTVVAFVVWADNDQDARRAAEDSHQWRYGYWREAADMEIKNLEES
jgi:hypothetical protein